MHLIDTSAAVPLVLASHAAHELTNRVVGDHALHLAGHAAVETFSVLTRLPGDARVAPTDAVRLLHERFAGVIGPTGEVVGDQLSRLADAGIAGGAVYDGLIALAVLTERDSLLYSRDLRATATYTRLGVAVRLIRDPA